jgi:hypothetical protein
VIAVHDGYRKYFSQHSRLIERKISLSGNVISVTDNVNCPDENEDLSLYFHFHHNIDEVARINQNSLLVSFDRFRVRMSFDTNMIELFSNKMAIQFFDSRNSISLKIRSGNNAVITKFELLNENTIYH